MKNKATALIIDDEADIRELIEMAFMGIGISCILSPTVKDAFKHIKKNKADFVITDMRLPDGDGLDLVSHIQKNYPNLPICVITAHGNIELAVKALKMGAFDFVNKPFDLNRLREMATSALKLNKKENEKVSSDELVNSSPNDNNKFHIIGESPIMKKLDIVIKKLARSQAPVFIHGESGTGKELVARNIHIQSARKDGPFIPVNCGAIPDSLVESELFGYKKGAFTGANKDTKGLFTVANGGTIFLDEVADLPLSIQVKLLRTIQERTIRAVGDTKEVYIDIRILSATHKNLSKLVEANKFREDLYYRLNVISLGIPPLRKRTGDISILSDFIVKKLAKQQGNKNFVLSSEADKKLNNYNFPGNIRELENILERATTFCNDNIIKVDDIHFNNNIVSEDDFNEQNNISFNFSEDKYEEDKPSNNKTIDNDENIESLPLYLEDIEKKAIESAISTTNNKKKAAEKLGMTIRSLRYKLQKYNID